MPSNTVRRQLVRELVVVLMDDLYQRKPKQLICIREQLPKHPAMLWQSPLDWSVVYGYNEGETVWCSIYSPDGYHYASTEDATPEWLRRMLP